MKFDSGRAPRLGSWRPIGHTANGVVDRLARQRDRMRVMQQLMDWHIDLSQRIADRAFHFLSRDCSIKPDDLVLEMERLRLAIRTRPERTPMTDPRVEQVMRELQEEAEAAARRPNSQTAQLPPDQGKAEAEDTFSVVCLESVDAMPIDWEWPGYLALGKITLIGGDPDMGKSQIAIDCGSRKSTGSHWPNGPRA